MIYRVHLFVNRDYRNFLFRNPPNDFVSKFSAPAGYLSVPARLCKWQSGSRNALAGHIVFEVAPAEHLGTSRNNRLVFLHVSSPFYILWCGWACFICMKAVGWACLSAGLFLFVGWDDCRMNWMISLYWEARGIARLMRLGFLRILGVSCQIRICDVTAKMPLVRGNAPETPDNVK